MGTDQYFGHTLEFDAHTTEHMYAVREFEYIRCTQQLLNFVDVC